MAEVTVAAPSRRPKSVRSRYNAFVDEHQVSWELAMAVLAIAYVALGFVADGAPPEYAPALGLAETALTALFVAEFASRFLASRNRLSYLRGHWIDLVALIPVARGLRVMRLIRLLRLVRAFAGVNRMISQSERLIEHRGLGTLIVACLGVMVLTSAGFYAVESDANEALKSPLEALWWGIATLTGGDPGVQAITWEGRVATGILLLIGIALFSGITATITSFMLVTRERPKEMRPDAAERLRRIAELRDRGILTAEEFEAKKAELLPHL